MSFLVVLLYIAVNSILVRFDQTCEQLPQVFDWGRSELQTAAMYERLSPSEQAERTTYAQSTY